MSRHVHRLVAVGIAVTLLVLGLCLLLAAPVRAEAATAATPARPIRTLVLYDAPPAGVDGNRLGKAYAIMLRNLLGHWDTTVEMLPMQRYTAGKLDGFDATFYLGSHYDLPVPAAFLTDARDTRRTVVWFKYKLWLYDTLAGGNLSTRRGLSVQRVRGLNAAPSAAQPRPGFFSDVPYKGRVLRKFYGYDPATGAITGDPDLGVVRIADPARVQTLVYIDNPTTGEQLPYVVRSGNFWYMADLPLTFIGPDDRYLVLCDLLHDMLGVKTATRQRALVRFEDVSALVVPANARQLTDVLQAHRVPFGIAVIPRLRDPLGVYHPGVSRDIPFAEATSLKAALDYMLPRGGRVVAHGWTHQYAKARNPSTGVSGDDYEFWDKPRNRPVAEDSTAWALDRVDQAIAELGQGPYQPFAFEAPHYQASPKAYAAIRQRFPVTWGRLVYYTSDTSDTPDLDPRNPDRDFAVGQFFPYVIRQDHYGNKVLPENLGNIQYDLDVAAMGGGAPQLAADLLAHAANAQVVRDGFASFYFHPFWLSPGFRRPGLQDFKAVIEGIEALGYTWADPAAL
jgi:uncharacterized protein YdaL